jgi:hypothetical protein
MLIDRLIYKNDIFKKSLFGATFISITYIANKYLYKNEDIKDENDLIIKKVGRCDKELIDFGNCLEKYSDNSAKCTDLLEAYKRCLQNP